MNAILERIKNEVMAGEEENARKLVEEGLEAGLDPRTIMDEAMMPAMDEIGGRFSRNEAFIPELIVAAGAMQEGMQALKPRLSGEERSTGLVVLGTVRGDIHSIGKNLVRMCMEGAGFDVMDIGEDIGMEEFVEAYEEHKPDILGLSALLSSTMQRMPEVIDAVRGIDPSAVIMVEGALITQEYADEIGASGYAPQRLRGGDQGEGTPAIGQGPKA